MLFDFIREHLELTPECLSLPRGTTSDTVCTHAHVRVCARRGVEDVHVCVPDGLTTDCMHPGSSGERLSCCVR
eukprot:COSAG01_NODE_8880_length_2628_cov_2.168841_4_plen_73_part_00